MKVMTKKLLLIVTTILTVVCLFFGGVFAFSQTNSVKADTAALQADFTNDGQFSVSKYNGAVPFEYVDGAAEGLPAGYDGAVLKLTTTTGSAYATLDFSASQILASKVESIVVRIYSPEYSAEDEFRTYPTQVQYGKGANDASKWCDVTLSAVSLADMTDANGYLSTISVGMRVYGGASVYYIDSVTVNMTQTTKVKFREVHFVWNNYVYDNAYCNFLQFDGGISGNGGLDADFSDLISKMTINGSPVDAASVKFYCPNWIGANGGIILRLATNPAAGSKMILPKGATFNIGGTDSNLYEIEENVYLQFNGSTWAPYIHVETVPVTLSTIHSLWNNYTYDNAHCTFLQFDGGISGNGNLDADFSDLLSKMTINGAAVDTNNVVFYCPNWIGASDGIVLRMVNNPPVDARMILPMGSTFTIGGSDTNVYEIVEEVCLQFDGNAWVISATYGTPTFAVPEPTKIGEWGWNHETQNTAVIKNTDYGYTIVSAWPMATNSENLAATKNLTSTSITLNGKSFYELYQEDDGYRLNAQLGYFAFSVPTSALVAGNGYDVPTLEIANGTPFYKGYYLPETTLIYNYGFWQLGVSESNKLSFVGLHESFNNDTNGFLIAQFDTDAWEQAAVPTSYSGITYNGKDIKDLVNDVKFYLTHSLWFSYTPSSPKLVAGYNGYSHPTIAIENGATVDYNGNTYIFKAVTFYLNFTTNKWQTEKPAGYVEGAITSFLSVHEEYNNRQDLVSGYSCTLLQFSGELGAYTGENLAGTLGANITVGGKALSEISGAVVQVGYNGGNTDHLWIQVPTSALVVDATSKVVELKIKACEFSSVILGDAALYLTDGVWLTTLIPGLDTPNCDFTGFSFWNNENGATLFSFSNFLTVPRDTTSHLETTGYYIKLNGKRLTEIPGANVYTWADNCWLRVDIPNLVDGDILTIEAGTPFAGNYLPRLAFKMIDGIWCKAFIVNIEVGDETFTLYSQDDVPLFLDDEYFATLLAERDIPGKVVSFSTRGVTYEAGTTLRVLRDTDLTVHAIGFNTEEGASVRLKTPTGIRFETRINKADYDALVTLYGSANVETGAYIVPRSFLGNENFRNYFADSTKIDGKDYVKVVNSGFANRTTAETDGYYQYYGSLVNIEDVNYCTEFFGIGYIKITDGDNVYIVYGGYELDEHTRSIYYVSSHAYKDYASGSTEKKVLEGYLNSVVYITDDMVISNVVNAEGYVSPYSVTHNAQTGVYTITGDAEIKSVMIGDKKRISSRTSSLEINGVEYYVTDYSLTATAAASTLTFKLSSILDPLSLVDFAIEVPSNAGVKILQITDTELMDAAQARAAENLSSAEKEEYARKNVYANCFNYITELVEQERPDLIVLTGDIVNGSFDDNGSMWLRLIEFMDSLDIPWAPVFGALDNQSAKGAAWQRAGLASAQNSLFKEGTVSGNGDYTIGITDNGVIKRVIYMLDSNAGAGINNAQIEWVKGVASNVALHYGAVPGFVFYNKSSATDFSLDYAAANIDGVFMGDSPNNNSSVETNGIYYTYGTKTGSYGEHNVDKLGGTYISVAADGLSFEISAEYLDKAAMQSKESILLVDRYDGSSLVNDAYLAPIWDTDRIYDETGLFVGETGSVTLMYTPTDPKEVVIRDITLGTIYTYGVDYTISGNKVTRIAGGNLPYMAYEEYYRLEPEYVDGQAKGFPVTAVNGKAEDGYEISGSRYLFFSEGFRGAERYVTFTYNKTEEWTGTKFEGDANAQSFINKLKTDKEATVFFYGDSITVGCNASGTTWGGLRNPFLPAWNDLVTNTLAEMYGAKITKHNGAVGGWTTAQGAENLNAKLVENNTSFAEIDLFIIAFGMNDPATSESNYIASIKQMINAYYAENPNGSILLVSPMLPNTQSSLIAGNQSKWENTLNGVKNSAEYVGKNISLAKVFSLFSELVSVSGKLTRDYLGNNVNHPNDFGVRIYAQVVLKTLCGDDFH